MIIGFAESPDELSERQPFIWTVDFGMRTLEDVLTERGLADEIAGLNLGVINGISADDRYMIGNGRDASGQSSPWLVDLGGFTPVPEPATYSAVLVMGLAGACRVAASAVRSAGRSTRVRNSGMEK